MKLEGGGAGIFSAGGGTIETTDIGVSIQKKNANMTGGLASMVVNAATASKGALVIPYSSISHVSISKGNWASPAFIQILTVGDRAVSDPQEAMGTPNCLVFKKDMLVQYERLKSEIEKRAADAKQSGNASGGSAADEIKKLAELKASGIITDREFEQKKKQLLGL